MCGVITVPCGLLVVFALPNYPTEQSGRPWYLTDAEFSLARERMARVKRVQTGKVFKLEHLKRVFSGWRESLSCRLGRKDIADQTDVYLLPLTYIFYGLACQATGYFGIFLSESFRTASRGHVLIFRIHRRIQRCANQHLANVPLHYSNGHCPCLGLLF